MHIAIGNMLVGSLNMLIDKHESFAFLKGTNYYALFFGMLVVDVFLFFLISRNFQEQTILQDDEPEPAE
jgi:POT family proton-dependent oligopeptide transporter